MLTSGSKTITWNSFNMPASVQVGANVYAWIYSADLRRVKVTTPAETTLYVADGDTVEVETVVTPSITEYRHYVRADGRIVSIHTTRSIGAPSTSYAYGDNLGSTTLVMDGSAAVAERLSYDAQGKRRYPSGLDDAGNTLSGATSDRGYTSHEHLDDLGLIHMNGRVYDPRIGRFLSPDPVEPKDHDPQRLNRFTYVLNNPFSYIDLSGFTDTATTVVLACQNCDYKDPRPIVVEGRRIHIGNGLNLGGPGGLSGGERIDRTQEDCKGSETQWMIGGGFLAGSGVPGPGMFFPSFFTGSQIAVGITSNGAAFLQFSAVLATGAGAYAGAGGIAGRTTSRGPTPSGISRGEFIQFDANAGAGPAFGVSGQISRDGRGAQISTPRVGRFGGGLGAQTSVGPGRSATLATPQFFPGLLGDCTD